MVVFVMHALLAVSKRPKQLIDPLRFCLQPTERYRFEEPTPIRRRDMRKGEQTCLARADSGKVEVTAEWGAPCAGAHSLPNGRCKFA